MCFQLAPGQTILVQTQLASFNVLNG